MISSFAIVWCLLSSRSSCCSEIDLGRFFGRLLLAVVLLSGALPQLANARPPRRAAIIENVGMAGVRVGSILDMRDGSIIDQQAGPDASPVRSGPMRLWGPVPPPLGYCYEGQSCDWNIPGGGRVFAEIGTLDNKLRELRTTSRRWKTRRGARVGMSTLAVRRLYGGRLRHYQRTCAIGGYGNELEVLALVGRHRTTAFEVRDGRIDEIAVLAYRLPNRSLC